MDKYSSFIPLLLERLGNASNIKAATHCVSRLRLVLEDESKLDQTSLEKLSLVKGVFKVNGQVHIIIGQEVADVFAELMKAPGMNNKEATAASIKQIGSQNQSFLKRMMNL